MNDTLIGLIITAIFIFFTAISGKSVVPENKSTSRRSRRRNSSVGNIESNKIYSKNDGQELLAKYMSYRPDKFIDSLSNSDKKIAKNNEFLLNQHKDKVDKLLNNYLPLYEVKIKIEIDDFYLISNYHYTPFNNFIQEEFEKIDCRLDSETLKFLGTGNYFFLYNQYGIIYTSIVESHKSGSFKFRLSLIFPVEYINRIQVLQNNSKIKLEIDNRYLREVVRRIASPNEFHELVSGIYNLSKNQFKYNNNYFIFYNKSIRENFVLDLNQSIDLLISSKSITLLEYLINLELGKVTFFSSLVLDLILDSRNFGSFLSKKRAELKISDTSKKILTVKELKVFYKDKIDTKEKFYARFNLYQFLQSIDISKFQDSLFYKKMFDYWAHISQLSRFDNHPNEFFKDLNTSSEIIFDSERRELLINEVFKGGVILELEDFIHDELRNAENEVRLSKGYNIVGAYTNESILFNQLKDYFNNEKVISQGSPTWLGRQRFDIYFPELNIAVEYHGAQHFRPVKHFGGEVGFEKIKKLDIEKKLKCQLNNCILIEVLEGYDISQIIKLIEEHLIDKNNSMGSVHHH